MKFTVTQIINDDDDDNDNLGKIDWNKLSSLWKRNKFVWPKAEYSWFLIAFKKQMTVTSVHNSAISFC